MDQCAKTCASFAVGTSKVTDMTGNTLGCRINLAVAASTMPAMHCPQAGPAGDLLTGTGFCSGGDACVSFCTLEIMDCGSVKAPLPGNPKDASGTPLFQYSGSGQLRGSLS